MLFTFTVAMFFLYIFSFLLLFHALFLSRCFFFNPIGFFISFSDCVGAFFLFLWLLLSANTIYSSTAPQFPCFTCLFVMLARRLIYSLALNCKSPWRARPGRNPSNSERTRDSRKRKEKEKRKTQKKICRDQPCPSVFSKMNKTS